MSQVTLTYAFLTAANAAAFAAHAATFDSGAKELAIPTLGKPSADKKDSKAKPAETPSTASPAPAASATPPAASPSPAPAPAEPTKPAVKYEDTGIGELIQKMVQKDRAAAVALLTKFGVKKGSELKPEQYDAFKTEAEIALVITTTEDLA